jgi:hypothetical protein
MKVMPVADARENDGAGFDSSAVVSSGLVCLLIRSFEVFGSDPSVRHLMFMQKLTL